MTIKRINEFPEGSGSLSNDDVFLFMDDPSNGGTTKKISLSEIGAAIGGGGGGNADTGDVSFNGIQIIGTGTLELVPNTGLYNNDQYLIVDPTAPNHIHLRAGGNIDESSAELILGGERAHVRVTDYNHQIDVLVNNGSDSIMLVIDYANGSPPYSSDGLTWFMVSPNAPPVGSTLQISGQQYTVFAVNTDGVDPVIGTNVPIELVDNGALVDQSFIATTPSNIKNWTFANDGNLSIPGNILLDNGTSVAVGSYDNNTGGQNGVSLNCAVGYELNWQGGRLKSTYDNGQNTNPLYLDSPLVVSSGNKIGIGTENPLYSLDVIGTGNFSQNLLINNVPVSISGHLHSISDISNLQSTLDGKANSSHNHTISDVTGLQTVLDLKVDTSDARLSDTRIPTDSSVTTAKLANGAVTAAKLAANQEVQFSSINLSGGTGLGNSFIRVSHTSGSGFGTLTTTARMSSTSIELNDGNQDPLFKVSSIAGVGIAGVGIVSFGQWQAGTIAVAYGGTGATTAENARTNLGAAAVNSPILSLGTLSGSNAINFGSDRLLQTLTLNGSAVTFTKGTGWPTTNVMGDIILRITVTSATSITWTIVNDWFAQPPAGALSIGTHLFLLRAIGSSVIEGHYIGSKTN